MSSHVSARRRWPWIMAAMLACVAVAAWFWLGHAGDDDARAARSAPVPVPVVTATAESRAVPVRLRANGTVTALQSVELRAQVTSTVHEVHIREGEHVEKGRLLFTLDARAQEADVRKAQAQVDKDRADLATAKRNLERQRELFGQKFISQAALEQAQSQVETLEGQLAVDRAAVEAARVQRAYAQIRAPFAGRTGAIGVRRGSLVQPNGAVLVTIAQIDPIAVSFALPERELPALQAAAAAGPVPVALLPQAGAQRLTGHIMFIDNAVDTATGTIRVKARFDNPQAQLWPGMYAEVEVAPRTIANATVVPAQAVQTGPENRFVYEVGADRKVTARPVRLAYVEEGFAVVDGVAPGARVVIEGAQNLRPGSTVTEAGRDGESLKGGAPRGRDA